VRPIPADGMRAGLAVGLVPVGHPALNRAEFRDVKAFSGFAGPTAAP
jgi:hypothetical protein